MNDDDALTVQFSQSTYAILKKESFVCLLSSAQLLRKEKPVSHKFRTA